MPVGDHEENLGKAMECYRNAGHSLAGVGLHLDANEAAQRASEIAEVLGH